MEDIIWTNDNYKFIIEVDKGFNVLLEETSNIHNDTLPSSILGFIEYLCEVCRDVQYIKIYDVKGKNRYSHLIKWIFDNKATHYQRWLLSRAHFIEDDGFLLVKVY